jgi:hypothetical protein
MHLLDIKVFGDQVKTAEIAVLWGEKKIYF